MHTWYSSKIMAYATRHYRHSNGIPFLRLTHNMKKITSKVTCGLMSVLWNVEYADIILPKNAICRTTNLPAYLLFDFLDMCMCAYMLCRLSGIGESVHG